MSRSTRLNLGLVTTLLIIAAVTFGLVRYYWNLPQNLSQHEAVVIGQNRLFPGSEAALRVLVRDSKDGAPLADSDIEVALSAPEGGNPRTLYTGRTGQGGAVDVRFHVPEDAPRESTLVVKTHSKLGSDTVERAVTIERQTRVLLTTDKPLYQPGQEIHIRALALSTFDLTPASGETLEIIVADGKGNKVFRQPLTTSAFGVAFTDFQLADEVNTGAYKITAALGDASAERTVTVEHYVLPKFALVLNTDQPYYQPGQQVSGTLDAKYFYGRPISEGQVAIEGFTYDVQRNTIFTLEGVTDAEGNYAFTFDLPAYIAGSDLEGGLARFYLQASVTDQAQHTESTDLSLPVAGSGLIIEAVPEASSFRPGVENILYVMTSTPDGRPVPASLRITLQNGTLLEAQTGEYGLAEVRFTPDSPYQYIIINASDSQGRTAQREFQFEGEWVEESVLLRPDRPFYKAGETMNLTILTNQAQGSVYLDIVREGQTVSTRAVDVTQGKAEVAVDLTPDLYGTLDLHAYKVLPSGAIVRDTRLVVVEHANDLSVSLAAGQESYLPGDTAQINLQVNDPTGQGVQSAVGLAVVDESVFALAEIDPGFARLYFLLEKEIMQPRYDLHGYSLPEMMRGEPSPEPALEKAASDAAQASLAEAVRQTYSVKTFSLVANSHQDAINRAQEQQRAFFTGFFKFSLAAVILLPLLAAGLVLAALIREKAAGRGLLIWAGLLASIVLFFTLVPAPGGYAYGSGFVDRMNGWLNWLMNQGEGLAAVLLLGVLAGLIILVITAIRRKDVLLSWLLGLVVLHLVAFGLLVVVSEYADTSSANEAVGISALVAFFLTPLALLLRASGFFARRRFLAALALLPLVFFPLAGLVPVLSNGISMSNGGMARDLGGPAMEDGIAMPAMAGGMIKKAEEQAAAAVPERGEVESPTAQGAGAQGAEPPRLRQYFPETMLWSPDIITNPDGSLSLDVPVADSITTWRMTALASSQDGRLGSVSAPLLVFQDFFIDLDLPLSLTVGDEVAIPVGIFNYLGEEQNVRLELKEADWFEPLGDTVQEMTIAPNDISVVYFRVRAVRFGMQPFQVTAWGSQMSDAIVKEVRVYPDGKEVRFSSSDRLNTGQPVGQTVNIPAEAIPGTQSLLVKIYPGVLSQVVEGLDSMLRMPFGCFEQTSSTTYPNLLVMDYLKTTGQAAPETQMKAEEYINLGYQRLTTFEVDGGGFSLFGEPPADRMLTAYGLQEFSDMSRVHPVDADLINRAAEWLFSQQAGDGSWENDQGLVHENTWSSLGNDRLPVTAYITWSLVEAGFGNDPRTQKGIQYVREYQSQAEEPYVLGLVANALVSADLKAASSAITPSTTAVLERLAGMALRDGEGAYWQSSIATFVGGEGQTGSIETTALAALALLRGESSPEIANAALVYLVRQKDSFGTWYSTQATVLTLKALLQSVRGSGESTAAEITITLNGGQTRTLSVTPENFDVVQMVSFDDINPGQENTVEIRAEGRGSMMYQVTGSYYLPWDKVALYPEAVPQNDAVTIDIGYDRTELAVNDLITEQVTVRLTEPGAKAEQAMIDLGIPPGFSVQTEDLDALVARYKDTPPNYNFPRIERYEMTGRQVLIYVTNLSGDTPLEFRFRLKARFPVSVQSPASSAYDYYNPGVAGEIPPQRIVVNP